MADVDETEQLAWRTGGVTVTVTEAEADPLSPVQDTRYEVLLTGETLTDPAVAPPVEKLVPAHEVAFVEFHVSVEGLPETIEFVLALRDAVGTGGGLTNSVALDDTVVAPSVQLTE